MSGPSRLLPGLHHLSHEARYETVPRTLVHSAPFLPSFTTYVVDRENAGTRCGEIAKFLEDEPPEAMSKEVSMLDKTQSDNGAATNYRILLRESPIFEWKVLAACARQLSQKRLGRQQTVDTVDGGAEAQHSYRHIESLKSHGGYLRRWTPPQCQRKVPSVEISPADGSQSPLSEMVSR
jgi:hypothetical protein